MPAYSDKVRENVASRLTAGGFLPSVAGEDFDRVCEAYATALAANPMRDLLLQGKCGCGKTFAARILSRSRRFALDFIDCANPVNVGWLDVKEHYTVNQIYERGFVLDDLGAERPSNEYGVLFNPVADFLCWYYSQTQKRGRVCKYPSIVTTNLSAEDLSARFGQRIVSRIYELFVVCPMQGEDKRRPIVIGASQNKESLL